ncbi:hypothetical protein [Methyloligella solikamskensis]|uniref:DUF3303 domain-containing protein n=1 Tax=Methyloligella solikamskensis TaxID=1177756 RepID=A0ABW3J7U5_9HYPH
MMLKARFPMEPANRALEAGRFGRIIEGTIERLKPEATYFLTEDGARAAIFVFDLKDQSDIPTFAEPLFSELDAEIELQPVMTVEDLTKGLEVAYKS